MKVGGKWFPVLCDVCVDLCVVAYQINGVVQGGELDHGYISHYWICQVQQVA